MAIAGLTAGDRVKGHLRSYRTFLSWLRRVRIRRTSLPVLDGAHHVERPRHLLLEPAVGRAAHWPGGGLRGFAVWALWLSRRRHMPAVVIVLFLGSGGVVDRHPAIA